MEKQKYLYKNSKCIGGTSSTVSTVSLINAWISMTGQRKIQKYRSLAYLGGFTIIAFATIWFLSQSPYTIEYDSKDKSDKSDKSNKSNKSNKLNKKGDDTSKSDKRSKSSVSWWSSIREKISNKLGFGKKPKSQKSSKIGKSSSLRNNNSNKLTGKLSSKKRIPKDHGTCGSASSSKISDANPNGSTGPSNVMRNNNTHGVNKSTNTCKKVQETRSGDSSNDSNLKQKNQATQTIRVESCGESSSSNGKSSHQKNQITCGNSLTFKSNDVKQQQLRRLKLKAQEARTNRENKYRLGDCSISISKHPEKVKSASPIINDKCLTKSLCQDIDNKEQNRPLTDLETKILETIKNISSIDPQVRERDREFYIPYTPLTLHDTFDQIGQDRVERYKKLLVKLWKQSQKDSTLESTLKMVQEFFREKKFYAPEDDDDCHEKQVDHSDDFDDFLEKLDHIQNEAKSKVVDKHDVDCPKFADILAQDEQLSKKRIERNLEILEKIDSYKKQGKETVLSIKKSIEMFNEQNDKYKGATRHLKKPSRFNDELNRFDDRLMDTKQQAKNLAEGIDDMETYLTETLELFNDDGEMNTAVAKHGPILIDDD